MSLLIEVISEEQEDIVGLLSVLPNQGEERTEYQAQLRRQLLGGWASLETKKLHLKDVV